MPQADESNPRWRLRILRAGGTLLFMGGTGGRRTAAGLAFISALTAALPAMTKVLALEVAPIQKPAPTASIASCRPLILRASRPRPTGAI